MKDKKPENLKRRGFLLAAGVGSAGAVAAVAVATGVGQGSSRAGCDRVRPTTRRRLRRDPPRQQLLPHGAGLNRGQPC